MASIYELTAEFNTLWALMEAGEISDETLADVFKNTQEELAIKLEGYCKFIKNCESDVAGIKAEIDRLQDRKAVLENTVKRAKEAMKVAVETSGENSYNCGTFKVSVSKSQPKVIIDDPYLENIPKRYLIPQDPTIDKKAILADLKAEKTPDDLGGIAHLEQGSHITIR